MLVQINESRSDYKPGGVHNAISRQWLARNARNLAIPNTDIPHRIEPCFRIHDPATFDDKVVLLSIGAAGDE